MSGGEALDLALGLLRAPARRGLLAARPLPSGMTALLEVAGGSPAAASDAAASIGATPEEMLEAARFFVQQVLLAEGADAYRILGVENDADAGRIRDHHRLLLRWLHPDRTQGEQWESALATRVNQAWTQLRTPAARAAYDSRLPAQPAPQEPHADLAPFVPPLAPAPRVQAGAAPVRRPGLGAIGFAVLTLACLGLGWLAFKGGSEPVMPDFHRVAAAASASAPSPAPEVTDAPQADLGAVAIIAAAAAPAAPPAPPLPEIVAQPELEPEPPPAPVVHRSPIPAGLPEARAPEVIPILPVAEIALIPVEAPAMPEFPVPEPLPPPRPEPAPLAADIPDPLQLFESANAAIDALCGWLASDQGVTQPAYADPPARLEAVGERLRLHERLGQGTSGQLSLDQRDWRLGAEHAVVEARYRLTARGREREAGSAHIQLSRHDSHWQLASLSLVADP